jgi:hypothetical protein
MQHGRSRRSREQKGRRVRRHRERGEGKQPEENMIALSDVALAHLAVAAGRIPVNRRRRWLVDVARSLETGEPMKPLGASTIPTRRWRARLACGEVLLRTRFDEDELATTLVTYNLIDFTHVEDPKALAQGVERAIEMLGDLSRRNELLAARIRTQLLLKKK